MSKKKNLVTFFVCCILTTGGLLSLPNIASATQPGLDLVYNGSGAHSRTWDARNPYTGVSHWVKVVDYDGIADDGSSHTVTVTYPNDGPTYELWFVEKRDANSAIYEFWDDTVPQPINAATYSGIYTYRVEDSTGDSSEAEDDLQVNTLSPPDERTFSPGFSTPRSMIAHFDNVYKNGVLYDDFESGFDPEKWESQPAEVVSNETQTVASGAITVDGDPSDWTSYSPAFIDPQGDSSGGVGADLKSVYAAMDGTHAYFMVETYNKPISSDATIEINFNYKPWQHHTHGLHTDLHINISDSTLYAWNDNDLDGNIEAYPISGYTVARGNVLEARIPLSEIENAAYFNPTFVNIWTAGAPPESGDDPSEVTEAISGEVHFERTWFPQSQSIWMRMTNPETVNELKATVRVESISSNSEWIWARIGGAFCRDDNGEVNARVGIKGNDTYVTVWSEYWDGNHLVEKQLLPETSLGPVTQGYRYELILDWYEPGRLLTFGVRGLDDSIDYTDSYTIPGPISAADNPYRAIGIASWVFLDTAPTVSWQAVPGANHYMVRLYNWDEDEIFTNWTKLPAYSFPPGILKANGGYGLRIYALRDHQWFEWDNASNSEWDLRFWTEPNEVQKPFINLRNLGVYTWNTRPPFGPVTFFNVRIHDAQGVPDNIESVEVSIPGGQTVNLYIDEYITANEGKYRGVYFGGTPAGPYTFTVTDKDGNTSDPVTETLDPQSVDYLDEASLTPANNTLIDVTDISFNWDGVTEATNYWIEIVDKDYNRVFSTHTADTQLDLLPGLLNENAFYRWRVENYREFWEDNLDNGSTSPPRGIWHANNFITTADAGTAPPGLNLDRFGVAVFHAPHPATGDSLYNLEFMAMVTDNDGVPENIKRVEVMYPPPSTIVKELRYDNSPAWGINYSFSEIYTDAASIPTGTYTFRVTDFANNEIEVQDTLTNVTASILSWPTNVTPADQTVVHTTTPTITWDRVPGAEYYKVRIMSAYRYPTVHWSDELTDTFYTIPDDTLANGDTHGYRVYAYREASDTEINFYSANHFWHEANPRFTIQISDTAPVIDSFSSDTTSGPVPLTVQFTCQASDPGGAIVAYHWDYDGDGTIDETSTSGPVTYTYVAPGNYPALVTVEDSDGELATSNPIVITVLATTGDTDLDGMPDAWEVAHGLSPNQNDANDDNDNDGLSNIDEYLSGTDPNDADSDNDGHPDGTDSAPLDDSQPADNDNDGIADDWETAHGLDPNANDANGDADEDGLSNYEESQIGLDPQSSDSDGDGVDDLDDPFPSDASEWADFDGDNVGDNGDNCPQVYNPKGDWVDINGDARTYEQPDYDLDGIGDACDEDADEDGYISSDIEGGDDCNDLDESVYPGAGCDVGGTAPKKDKNTDPPNTDGDAWPDAEDNCPSIAQANQDDSDSDGYGDACDSCPNRPNPDQLVPQWYKDQDNDGYSDGTSLSQCDQPAGYNLADSLTALAGDCDDADGSVNPGAAEVPNNGKDDDCNANTTDEVQAYFIEPVLQGGVSYDSWLPEDGQPVVVDFTVKRADGSVVPGVSFTLSLAAIADNPSAHAGAYLNDSAGASADFDTPVFSGNRATLMARDYGGSITIHAEASFTDGGVINLQDDIEFPKDSDGDGMADGWELGNGLNPNIHDAAGDSDADGLSNFEEYRGVKWGKLIKTDPNSTYNTAAYVPAVLPQGAVVHMRTDPQRRDFFVKFAGYTAADPFAIGEAFYKAGIDVHALGESVVVSAGIGDNHIDVASVTYAVDTYGSESGHIDKRGIRDWGFATLGFATWGTDPNLSYGSKCKVYKPAIDYYFNDKPYEDYTTLIAGGDMREQSDWDAPNGQLDPIAVVEDKNDNGDKDKKEDKSGDGLLDGDRCMPGAVEEWDYTQNFSAFNVNNNDKVELPVVGSAADVNSAYEYSRAQVIKHITTHELGHNVGISIHTSDAACAMFNTSTNFIRDDFFSPDAVALIRIHNN